MMQELWQLSRAAILAVDFGRARLKAMVRRLRFIPVFLLITTLSPSASADIYQCKDKDGVLHFTNTGKPSKRCKLMVREKKVAKAAKKATKARTTTRASAARSVRFNQIILKAARFYQLPEALIRAVMRVESNFNPSVVSHAGAMGLMQLMPRTAESMGVQDPFDPQQNILGGARYLRILVNEFDGDMIRKLAAYNAGEGAVRKYGGVPPYKETQRYVRRVMKHYYDYRKDYGS